MMNKSIKRYKESHYLFEDIYKLDDEKNKEIGIAFKGSKYTYEEIEKSVDYFAYLLKEKGVKKGDHVALLSMNCYNWVIAFYAIIKVGGVAVLLNYMARHETLVELINNTRCKYIVYGRYTALVKQENELRKLLKETDIAKQNAISIRFRHLNFKEVLKDKEIPSFTSIYSREEDSKRTSFIIFTTGTTAKPKAACLSQYGMMNVIYLNFARLDPIFPQKFMCLLPLFHCFGLLVINAYMAFQRTVYISTMLDKKTIYKDFIRSRCGDCASVGIIYDKLSRAPFWWAHKARFIKHAIVGGGFTSPQEFEFLKKKYPRTIFMNGYGQTECSPMISLVYPDAPIEKQQTTVGIPMKGIELKFIDPTTKKAVKKGEVGEILVKGYNVFNGYYNMSKDKQPFDEDGYLHTGDLGYLDKDGYLVLKGRIKDIIIRKGENISPSEIEHELAKFKEFGKVRVLGIPSIDEGEYIIGCVELKKKPLHFDENKYLSKMAKVLPSIKIPSHIIYMKRFPLTANGKIDEMKLKEISLFKISKFLGDEVFTKKTSKLIKKTVE